VSTAVLIGFSAGATLAANIFVVGGKPDDPFWSIVKRGGEDAGKGGEAEGGKVTWLGAENYENLGVDAAELIRQAIDQKADAIVGPDWVPEAMDPAFKAVRDAGIPLVIYNAGGLKAADRLGAMNYVGSDDYKGGVAAGEYLAKAGNKKGVCINTLPGAANSEAFCSGFKEGMKNGGGEADVLPLPATSFGSATAVAQAVKAYLAQKGVNEQRVQAEGRGESQPVTGDQCKNMGPERKKNAKLVACLQPDRRVEIEVLGSREVAGTGGTPSSAGSSGASSGSTR